MLKERDKNSADRSRFTQKFTDTGYTSVDESTGWLDTDNFNPAQQRALLLVEEWWREHDLRVDWEALVATADRLGISEAEVKELLELGTRLLTTFYSEID